MKNITDYFKKTYVVLYLETCNGPTEKFKRSFYGGQSGKSLVSQDSFSAEWEMNLGV